MILGLFTACSSAPPAAENAEANNTSTVTKDTAPKTVFDTDKPTSYTEYKRWRSENDPASEAYSEYKEWEINYRGWKARQENN